MRWPSTLSSWVLKNSVGESISSSGKSFQCVLMVKHFLLVSNWNLLRSRLYPSTPAFFDVKRGCPSSWQLPMYWYIVIRSPLRLLFSVLNKPSSLSFLSYGRVSRPLTIHMALLWMLSSLFTSFFVQYGRKLHAVLQVWHDKYWAECLSLYSVTIISLFLLVMSMLTQPSILQHIVHSC